MFLILTHWHNAARRWRSSPVPELMPGVKRPRLEGVQLQEDLQYVEPQEDPLGVRDKGVLLIQSDKHGIH